MIYTSYFDKLEAFPKDAVPISICITPPEWYSGLEYKKLAPKPAFFKQWKINHDNNYYITNFNEQVLSNLDATSVCSDINRIASLYIRSLPADDIRHQYFEIILLCYEEPIEFCHRHLVSKWLREHGIDADELKLD